jgi:hypothetical protein
MASRHGLKSERIRTMALERVWPKDVYVRQVSTLAGKLYTQVIKAIDTRVLTLGRTPSQRRLAGARRLCSGRRGQSLEARSHRIWQWSDEA